MSEKKVQNRLLPLLLILIGATAAVVLYRFDPAATSWMPRCPSYALFGLHCSGCGTTRAIHALLHGDVMGAMRMNWLLLPALLLLVLLWFKPRWSYDKHLVYGVLTVVVLYAVLRNIPCAPFSMLAPQG